MQRLTVFPKMGIKGASTYTNPPKYEYEFFAAAVSGSEQLQNGLPFLPKRRKAASGLFQDA